jgi:hypothetical protein
MDLKENGWGGVWSGFTWLRIGTVGGLLWLRWWTFGFWRHGVGYDRSRAYNIKFCLRLVLKFLLHLRVRLRLPHFLFRSDCYVLNYSLTHLLSCNRVRRNS